MSPWFHADCWSVSTCLIAASGVCAWSLVPAISSRADSIATTDRFMDIVLRKRDGGRFVRLRPGTDENLLSQIPSFGDRRVALSAARGARDRLPRSLQRRQIELAERHSRREASSRLLHTWPHARHQLLRPRRRALEPEAFPASA